MKSPLLLIALLVLSQPVLAQRNPASLPDLAARVALLEQQLAALQPSPGVAGSTYRTNTLFTNIYAGSPQLVQSFMIAATELEMSFYQDGTGLAVQTACEATRLTDPEFNVAASTISSDQGLCWPAQRPFEYVQTGNDVLITFQSGLALEITVSDDGGHIVDGTGATTFGVPSPPSGQTTNSGYTSIWTGVRLSD